MGITKEHINVFPEIVVLRRTTQILQPEWSEIYSWARKLDIDIIFRNHWNERVNTDDTVQVYSFEIQNKEHRMLFILKWQ